MVTARVPPRQVGGIRMMEDGVIGPVCRVMGQRVVGTTLSIECVARGKYGRFSSNERKHHDTAL